MAKVKLTFKNGKWYRNGVEIKNPDSYRFYDSKTNTVKGLSSNGSYVDTYKNTKGEHVKTKTPHTDELIDKRDDWEHKLAARNSKEEIPFIPEKRITLSNAGRLNGAVLSTNMLDSIAKYSERTGLPLKTAIGLAGAETTLGNPTEKMEDGTYVQYINQGVPYKPADLVNYHYWDESPYQSAVAQINRDIEKGKYAKYRDSKNPDNEFEQAAKLTNSYTFRQAQKDNRINIPILEQAFLKYKNNPNSYNPKQANYQQTVNNVANEAWASPEIQQWLKNRNKNKKRSLEETKPL